MTGAIAPLTDFSSWARGNLLEIVLLVLGAILLTRVAEWVRDRITRQIDAAGAPVRVSTSFAVDDYYDGHAWLLLTMTDNETGRVTVVPR